jgi:HAD superfamily hydrolase (TIGR01484 family)
MDDTLTLDGHLPAASYSALENLQQNGFKVVVVTGRPGGWCDLIARFWPVDGVVGENGAFYFRYDHSSRKMIRQFQQSEIDRADNMVRLKALYANLAERYPGFAISADQAYRETDLAIDFCEDVEARPMEEVIQLRDEFTRAGATAKISSIHINAWFGDYSKLEMSEQFFSQEFDQSLADNRSRAVYAGDSPNDEPMFEYFPYSVGVANVRDFSEQMTHLPKFVTQKPGGFGFEELAAHLIENKA